MNAPGRTVEPAALARMVEAVLAGAGALPEHAACVADSLVGANLAGHDSHGVAKLPSYVKDIRTGRLRPRAVPEVRAETPATAVVDGAGTFGHVAARLAADLAVRKARATGLAAVGVAHCHHTGRLGGWVESIAGAGLVGMALGAEANPPYKVVPHGGVEGALATNPVAWAVPRAGGEPPVLLDYATSTMSIGKLRVVADGDGRVPEGSLLDAGGRPTVQIDDFFSGGWLLPFGGHKGYALGVVADLLAVGLSGGHRAAGPQEPGSCLHVLAVDPAAFQPREAFLAAVERTVDRLRAARPAAGTEVLLPGEPETRSRLQRRAGIPLPAGTWDALVALAGDYGVDVP